MSNLNERAPPLQGTVVLDLTRILAGPWCTQLLADFGAEVIKIERPGTGDDTRSWGPPWLEAGKGEGEKLDAAYFGAANRNKKSVAIDIATPQGQDTVRRLVAKADVLIENFKVGDLARYGLDYESLRKLNPALIYCSITGYGQTGPYAQRPGYDFIFQGEAGLMSVTGERDDMAGGGPQKVGVAAADLVTGMYACSAILAALNSRQVTGIGQAIDLALFDCTLAFGANLAFNHVVSGAVPHRFGNGHPVLVPYQSFKTSDGNVVVAAGNDTQWQRFCKAINRADLAADKRYITGPGRIEHRAGLLPELEATILRAPSAHWLQRLESEGVPHGNINNYGQAFAHPQAVHRQMRIEMPSAKGGTASGVANPVRFSQTPVVYRWAAPKLGQHTEEVLRKLSQCPVDGEACSAVTEAQVVVRDGLALNWAGAGSGLALLLLHGGHGGLVHWCANIEDLAQDHRVLAPDLFGFGQSSDPGRCLTPDEHAQLLAHWLRQLGINQVRVVGFSFGALVGLALALAGTVDVAALVLVNPPGIGPRSADALALPHRMSDLAKARGRRAGIEGTLRELMLARAELVTPDLVERMTVAAGQTRYVTRAMSRGSQNLPLLGQLRIPTRVLIGERDPFHSNDLAGRQAAIDDVLGSGATRIVPGAAHWLQYDQPECFASELRHFFSSIHKSQETT